MTAATHTQGPWHAPCFATVIDGCDCRYVLSEGYAGSICEVSIDNGIRLVTEGGNDCPPLEEAKANAHLIADAPAAALALALICAGVAVVLDTEPKTFRVWFNQSNGQMDISVTPLADTWTATINAIGWDRCREALAARGGV